MPLPDALADIADRIVSFYNRAATPPFVVYQYDPTDEYAVRRELADLKLWLNAKHDVECRSISLAEILWEALQEHGQLEMVIEAERAGAYDDANLAVRQILASPPTVAERIVRRVLEAEYPDRPSFFTEPALCIRDIARARCWMR